MSNDSGSYCSKCKKRKTCSSPCYPVEHLLSSVTSASVRPPAWYVDYVAGSSENFYAQPRDWKDKPLKQKIVELYFLDHVSVVNISRMVGCSHPYVSRVISDLLKSVRN